MTRLLPDNELPEGGLHRVEHEGHSILLCRVDGIVHAVADTCTHEEVSLSLGALRQHCLRCPLHGSEFDVRTGQVLSEPADTDLAVYPVKVEAGWIVLDPGET